MTHDENMIDAFTVPSALTDDYEIAVQLIQKVLSDKSIVYDIWIGNEIEINCTDRADADNKFEMLRKIML